MKNILVIEDDKMMANLIRISLEKDGYRVQVSGDGSEGLELGRKSGVDLILLDLMLPEISGFDIIRMLRIESKVPIIMLTARSAEGDKLQGLNLGADDYITKPFSPRELVARVRTVLRRTYDEQAHEGVVQFGDITVDFLRHETRLKDVPVELTPKEFSLLATLVKEPGRAFSRLELLERVFGYNYEGLERALDAHITRLRKKIEVDPAEPQYILTVYGLGYKLGDVETQKAKVTEASHNA
jgi:DNA-binding response OmpR family regulator